MSKRVRGYVVWKRMGDGRPSIESVFTGQFTALAQAEELRKQGFSTAMESFWMNGIEPWPQPTMWVKGITSDVR